MTRYIGFAVGGPLDRQELEADANEYKTDRVSYRHHRFSLPKDGICEGIWIESAFKMNVLFQTQADMEDPELPGDAVCASINLSKGIRGVSLAAWPFSYDDVGLYRAAMTLWEVGTRSDPGAEQ